MKAWKVVAGSSPGKEEILAVYKKRKDAIVAASSLYGSVPCAYLSVEPCSVYDEHDLCEPPKIAPDEATQIALMLR